MATNHRVKIVEHAVDYEHASTVVLRETFSDPAELATFLPEMVAQLRPAGGRIVWIRRRRIAS